MNLLTTALLFLTVGQNADADTWWSLRALKPTAVAKGEHPIDFFVREKLKTKGLQIGPEASRISLIRRVSLDLTGLPPTPEEMQAFVQDERPGAYERLVDRLLASPRYGERMARLWLDVARYAESHGHDQDRLRPHAWRFRDWTIEAFNRDMPYADFARAQIAADGYPSFRGEDIPALGFLAAGPWDESSLRDIREDTIDREQGRYLDRDDMVSAAGNAFLGLTVQCARCHDHKFDPISQEEYYSLQAVFSGVDKANRAFDPDKTVTVKRERIKSQITLLEAKNPKTWEFLALAENQNLADSLEAHAKTPKIQWTHLRPLKVQSDGESHLTVLPDNSVLASGKRPEREEITIEAPVHGAIGSVRLEVLAHDSQPHKGPGRQDNGNLHLSEIEVWRLSAQGPPERLPLTNPRADWDQEGWTAAHAIDGNEATAWGIYPKVGVSHQAAFSLVRPLLGEPGTQIRIVLKQLHGRGHLIGRPRLSVSSDSHQPLTAQANQELARILSKDRSARSLEEQKELARSLLLEETRREMATLPEPQLVYAAASQFDPDGSHKPAATPRMVRLLKRGDIRKPGEVAKPGALQCLDQVPDTFANLAQGANEEVGRRTAFANWTTHPNNPLFWRVIVNRVWASHFGTGIVDTPNDFGKMGGMPSHPELLDWLAIDFRDHGGSLKSLHKLIVTSAAYKQSWRDDPQARAIDSANRLLWRWKRPRIDAEQFRDSLLYVSGRLDERRGGPSDQLFAMKPGIHVTPIVEHAKFDWTKGKQRRSVYSLVFRTIPDPFIECLDGADPTASVPKRGESHSPLQALTIWNGDFVLSQVAAMDAGLEQAGAKRSPHEKQANRTQAKVQWVCEKLWCRQPTPKESDLLARTVETQGTKAMIRLAIAANAFAFID